MRIKYKIQVRFASANGSTKERSSFSGSRAEAISDAPNGSLIFARGVHGPAVGVEDGAQVLFLSFSLATSTEGIEMERITLSNSGGNCHQAWRIDHSEHRPHTSLGKQTQEQFESEWQLSSTAQEGIF